MSYFKKKILMPLLLFNSFVCIDGLGQDDSTAKQILEIKKECDRINNDTTKFNVSQRDVFGQSTEGGFLRTFYDGKTLRKAVLTLYGETGQSTDEYYLLNEEVIFVYEKGLRYKNPIYMGKTEIMSEQENKYYFKRQRLVRWIGNDGKTIERELYWEKEEEILESLKLIK